MMPNFNNSKALVDFLSLTGGEVAGKIAGFLAFTYLARVLNPESYGGVELAFGLLTMFAMIVDFGLGPIGAKTISHPTHNAKPMAAQILSARLLLATICIPLMCLIGYQLNITRETWHLIVIMSLSLFFIACYQKWIPQGLERMTLVSASQAMKMALFMAGILLLVSGSDDLYSIGFIEIVSCLMIGAYFIAIQLKYLGAIELDFSASNILALLSRAKFIGGSNAIWSLTQNIPFIALAAMLGATDVAWFGAASRISQALSSFSMAYHFNMYPTVNKRLNTSTEAYHEYSEPSMRITAWGGIFVAFVITLIAAPLCVFVFGEQYIAATQTLSILIWTLPIAILSAHGRWLLIAGEKQHYMMFSRCAGCVSCALLCILLIPPFGVRGAAIALVSAYLFVWMLEHILAAKSVAKLPLKPVIIPTLAAASLLTAAAYVQQLTPMIVALLILMFLMSAGLIDQKLRTDIPRLIRIKNSNEYS